MSRSRSGMINTCPRTLARSIRFAQNHEPLTCEASDNAQFSWREYLRAAMRLSPASPCSLPTGPSHTSRIHAGHTSIGFGETFLRASSNVSLTVSTAVKTINMWESTPLHAAISAALFGCASCMNSLLLK